LYRLVFSSIGIIMMTSGCGMKPISSSYYNAQVVQKKPIMIPRHSIHPVLPKEELYSIHEYARFMYERDCEELLFRKKALYERDIKQYALDTIDVLDKIEGNLRKNKCR